MTDIEQLAQAWIRRQSLDKKSDEADQLWWTEKAFIDLPYQDPDLCWQAILLVLELTTDEWVLTNLAAGPLESLLSSHREETIIRLEKETPRNPRLRAILPGVWISLPRDLQERFEALRSPP